MRKCFSDYIERSMQIRALSMPLEQREGGAEAFYRQYQANFGEIRRLLQENRLFLQNRVELPLKDVEALSDEEADELMAFSDELANTRTLEMVDVRLAWQIVSALEGHYRNNGDRQKYIHCLFREEMLAYNVGQVFDRGRLTDELAGKYRDCILECAKKAEEFQDDIQTFAALPHNTQVELVTIELFRSTGYERPYYDEQLILNQIRSYQQHIRRISNPAFQKAAPDIKWEESLYSSYIYLMDVHEFLDWHKTPDDILRMLDEAGDQALALLERNKDNTQRDPSAVFSSKQAIGFYRGRTSFEDTLRKYVNWQSEADPNAYDQINMSGNVMPVVFVQGICREHPEKIAVCHDFLKDAQQRTFTYIEHARNQGAYNTMQRFIGYMLDYYIELEDGIPFSRYFENLMAVTQPTLFVHCSMVAQIAEAMLDTLVEKHPEKLVGVCACRTPEEVLRRREEIRTFLRGCGFLHDAGKLFFLDTINLYNRMLFDDEFELIRRHAEMGYDILQRRKSTRPFAEAALLHHKWYNGIGGYPKKASYDGVENAILYQILTCADCLDAATDSVGRAYSKSESFEDMMEDLRRNSGRMFNPDLVALFEDERLQKRVLGLLRKERRELYYQIFGKRFKEG